jgi:hypothetical protein
LKEWQSITANHGLSGDWVIFWAIWDGGEGWDVVHRLRAVERDGVDGGGGHRGEEEKWVVRLGDCVTKKR